MFHVPSVLKLGGHVSAHRRFEDLRRSTFFPKIQELCEGRSNKSKPRMNKFDVGRGPCEYYGVCV